MEQILHQLISILWHYLQSFLHPRWGRSSAINSSPNSSPQKIGRDPKWKFDGLQPSFVKGQLLNFRGVSFLDKEELGFEFISKYQIPKKMRITILSLFKSNVVWNSNTQKHHQAPAITTSWWLNQPHLKNMIVKLDHLPQFSGRKWKIFALPPPGHPRFFKRKNPSLKALAPSNRSSQLLQWLPRLLPSQSPAAVSPGLWTDQRWTEQWVISSP